MSDIKGMRDVDIFNMAAIEALKRGYSVSSGKTAEIYQNLMLAKYGGQIKEPEPIKPINEHEWSDDFISSVLRFANPSHVSIYLDDGAHGSVDLSVDDLKALSKSLGYDMVKRQSGGVKG